MPNQSIPIIIKRSRIVTALISLTAILLFLHGLGLYFRYELEHPLAMGFVPLFNFDTEGNVPTFYSSLLLLVASLLFYWAAQINRAADSKQTRQWHLLSLIFFFLALDESAAIHELLIDPLRTAFHLKGLFYFSWVIVGMVGVLLLGIFFLRFVISLPAQFRTELLLAAALYLTGVIGLELVGSDYASIHGLANLRYELIATGEELFETAGLITLINALIKYIQTHLSKIEITAAD